MAKYKVRISDLREMSLNDRKKLLDEWRRELVTLRYKASTGALDNPGKLREFRKNIARLLTIIREEELSSKEKR